MGETALALALDHTQVAAIQKLGAPAAEWESSIAAEEGAVKPVLDMTAAKRCRGGQVV